MWGVVDGEVSINLVVVMYCCKWYQWMDLGHHCKSSHSIVLRPLIIIILICSPQAFRDLPTLNSFITTSIIMAILLHLSWILRFSWGISHERKCFLCILYFILLVFLWTDSLGQLPKHAKMTRLWGTQQFPLLCLSQSNKDPRAGMPCMYFYGFLIL